MEYVKFNSLTVCKRMLYWVNNYQEVMMCKDEMCGKCHTNPACMGKLCLECMAEMWDSIIEGENTAGLSFCGIRPRNAQNSKQEERKWQVKNMKKEKTVSMER